MYMSNSKKGLIIVGICVFSLFFSGCGNKLPEEDMVENGQAFEMERSEDDLQASSFPEIGKVSESNSKNFMTLKEINEEVKNLLAENYYPDIDISSAEIKRRTGMSEDMYIECLAREQEAGEQIDTLIIVHAKEDSVGLAESALENYRDGMIKRFENHPLNLAKAEASRVETIKNYVCFVQLGADLSQMTGEKKEALINHCLDENERALHVIEKAILDS